MIKINIKKQNVITNSATFPSQELADTWLAECKANESFGKAAYSETLEDESVIEHEAEYTVEIEDITAEIEQQKINTEALAYLIATDYMVVRAMEDLSKPVSEEVKLARQEARNSIVK